MCTDISVLDLDRFVLCVILVYCLCFAFVLYSRLPYSRYLYIFEGFRTLRLSVRRASLIRLMKKLCFTVNIGRNKEEYRVLLPFWSQAQLCPYPSMYPLVSLILVWSGF